MWSEILVPLNSGLTAIQRAELHKRSASRLSLFLLAGFCALGQAQPHDSSASPCSTEELKKGLLVESVAKNSEGEKAGLAEGDTLSGWSRGELSGTLPSPFDLFEIEAEQAPRGRVRLHGARGALNQTWVVGSDGWGIQTRPILPSTLLDLYLEGQERINAGKSNEGAEQWRAAAAESKEHHCSWLGPWFVYRAARALFSVRQWKDSEALFQEAIGLSGTASPRVRAKLFEWLALTFEQESDWTDSEKYYQAALKEMRESAPESLSAATLLADLGIVDLSRGDLKNARPYFSQALDLQDRLARDSLSTARTLNNLAIIEFKQGDLVKADEHYRSSLAINEKLNPDGLNVAISLLNLGSVDRNLGDLNKAEEYYRRALDIYERLAPGGPGAAKSLSNLGNIAYQRGNLVQAQNYYLRGLDINQKLAPGSLDVVPGLDGLGAVALERGDLRKAEQSFRQALEIGQRLAPGSLGVADDLNNLGVVEDERGVIEEAEHYFHEGMEIREKLAPDSLVVATSLSNLGSVELERGALDKSEQYLQQALEIQEKVAPDTFNAVSSLRDLAQIAEKRGDLSKAGEYARRALEIDERVGPGSPDIGKDLRGLGNISRDLGNLDEAESYYRRAIEARKNLASEGTQYAESIAALAAVMRDRHQTVEAEQLYSQAIDVLENQVTHLGGSGDVRSVFRAKHADYYSDYADLLLAEKQPELAFQVLERSRARSLLETLTEAHVNIRHGADAKLLEEEQTLQVSLAAKSTRRINLLEGKHTDEQVAAFSREIDDLLKRYQRIEEQIRMVSPIYAGLTQPRPMSASEVQQQLLDANTVLLEYSLGEKHSVAFVLTQSSLAFYELPKRSEIEEAAHRVYGLLTSRNRRIEGETSLRRKERMEKGEASYQSAVSALSRMILGPFAGELGRKRLLIAADGALQYIPFTILPVNSGDGAKATVPLVAEHEIVNLPSASVLAALRRQAAGRVAASNQVAVLADPVFDNEDSRVSKPAKELASNEQIPAASVEPSTSEGLALSLRDVFQGTRQTGSGLPRLVFSRREADTILAMADTGKGMEAVDFQASRETALSKNLGQYRIVHFATHGLLDNEHPELSGLVLSLVDREGKPQNGFLDLEDVYNLNLPVDLVVLSACETGLGKQIGGEGLVGLTRGFMYAGASRVVASLWKVDDAATADLMARFYRGMLKEGLPPAAALRQAQTEMLKQKRWADPYFWAAFTIQGEWK